MLPRGLSKWGLPVVVVGAAIGLHFAINVPRGEIEPRIPTQPTRAQVRAKQPEPGSGGGFRPRRAVRLQELRRQFGAVPFEKEPIDAAFARAHEGVLSRAVSVAQSAAFAGAPEVPQVEVEVGCRTIRCRVDACSEFPPELELMGAALQSLRVEGEPLFHRVDVEPTNRGALGKEPAGLPCHRFIVSFEEDLPDRSKIEVPKPEAEATAGSE